jgi:uracil-DNA glycosylase
MSASRENSTISAIALAQRLDDLARSGVTHLPLGVAKVMSPAVEVAKPQAAAIRETPRINIAEEPMARLPISAHVNPAQAQSLDELNVLVKRCTACAELASTRTQTVFGVGNPKARLCFMGEAPGADEDRLGEPFVGRSGQLLTKIIEACKMTRDDVYILNVIKCRPPGNRNPAPDESASCRGFLLRQLQLIQPEYICCLGAVAAQNLLQTQTPIGKLRGKVHEYEGIKVVCTYHPAYLLRNPPAKKDCWEDMKFLFSEMGISL